MLTDFDSTMTAHLGEGNKAHSSFAVLGRLTLERHFPGYMDELFHKYHPFEVDTSIDYKIRYNAIAEWLHTINQALVRCDIR